MLCVDVRDGLIGVGMISYDKQSNQVYLEKDYNNISKFLNRLLGIKVKVQNALFDYFNETLSAVILQAKRNGRWDVGIQGIYIHSTFLVKTTEWLIQRRCISEHSLFQVFGRIFYCVFSVIDLGKQGEAVKKLETETFVGTFSGVKTKIELHTVSEQN